MPYNQHAMAEPIVAGGIYTAQCAASGGAVQLQLVTLENSLGTRVTLSDLGAGLYSVYTADRYGHSQNILLTYEAPDHWLDNGDYLGVAVGRVANRIGGAGFELEGREYRLAANDGANHLHGGPDGLSKKRWQIVQTESGAAAKSVTFRCESADGEGGYPGRLQLELTYRLGEDNTLSLEYCAQADRATPVNPTNHCYWNLAGRGGILDHELEIPASRIVQLNEALIPSGALLPVQGTPVDFRRRKKIGLEIDQWPGGYDNYWVLDERVREEGGEKILRPVSTLTHAPSGRRLGIASTEPGVQFYSGNFLDGSRNRDGGEPIQQYAGVCLEPHGYPDAVNHQHFPSVILLPGQEYSQTTVYAFSTE